jgi:hypothetical protein
VLEAAQKLLITHRTTSRYQPQSNGLTEWLVRTIKGVITRFGTENDRMTWDEWLPYRVMGYCMSNQAALGGYSPYFPMHGRHKSRVTATSPPFVPKDKGKVGVSGSASVLVTPVCSRYVGALTKPKSSVSDKVETSSSGSSAMAAAMQHANTAPAFLAAWNAAPNDNARQALEYVALTHGTTAVRVEALLKRDERLRVDMAALQASLNAATAAVNAANANAQAAQVVAAAATASTFKPATSPRYENKDKDMEICKRLPVVEDYAKTCNDGEYLRIVSSFLHGKPRSYFQSKYDAYKAANERAEPASPRKFFRKTMISGYGLSDQT